MPPIPTIKASGARMGVSQSFYFGIAERSYNDFLEKRRQRDEARKLLEAIDSYAIDDEERHQREIPHDVSNAEASAAAISTIVFSAMCLEAAIYDFAAWHLDDTYVRTYLDKLDLVAKWMVIPKLIAQQEIPTGFATHEHLKTLVTLRNSLVHHRSIPVPFGETDRHEKWMELNRQEEGIQDGCIRAIRAVIFLSLDMDYIFSPHGVINPLPLFREPSRYGTRSPYSPEIEKLVVECREILIRSRRKAAGPDLHRG